MKLNLIIPESTVKVILYVVVLLSGISILLRKDKSQEEGGRAYVISDHLAATLILGFVTGAVCSLSGAGDRCWSCPFGGSGNRHQDRGGSGPL